MIADSPLASVPVDAAGHFKLYYYGAVLSIVERLAQVSDSQDAAIERFPFLTGYVNELAGIGLEGLTTAEAVVWWRERVQSWEAGASGFMPIRALRAAAGLSYETLITYFTLGLGEEDPRFGVLFEALQGLPGQHHLTYGWLNAAGLASAEGARAGLEPPARGALRQLQDVGLVRVINPDAPRFDWALEPTPPLWDAISGRGVGELAAGRGARGERPRVVYRPPERLLRLDELIVPPELAARLRRLPALLASGQVDVLLVRGPQGNGRRTLLGAIAAELGRGRLDVPRQPPAREAGKTGAAASEPSADELSRLAGPLATLLNALPIVACELGPGETAELPRLAAYDGPLGVAMGRQGGLREAGQLIALSVEMPSPAERRAHWCRALRPEAAAEAAGSEPTAAAADLDAIARRFRLTSGAIYRTADLARAWSALAVGRPDPGGGALGAAPPTARAPIALEDVQQASRALNRQALDTLAQPVPAAGTWSDLATRAETIEELLLLESRCRHRERLATDAAPAFGAAAGDAAAAGVRALFTGPSGTGKTFAARILASVLTMDLYRVDLSSVVNKYIGETEKNLNELFTRAEELDVILLIDEGDALLTQRTSVQTSNDRYANLETNFLLQRLESYGGIVVITTNAGERIDSAFQRRMDVVVEFRAPEPAERWAIWQLHLPADHRVDPGLLREVAARCPLTGGQIRNTVLHASVLALDGGGGMTSQHVEAAVHREYRKSGGVYPLRVQYG